MYRYISTSFYLIIGVLIVGVLVWSQDSLADGTIRIQKDTVPSGFDNFDFTINAMPFILDDGEFLDFDEAAGMYTVTETDTASGFELTSILCNSENVTVDLENNKVDIMLADDETIICTFTNTGTSTI